ncbi:MAG: N-acetylmuramoyl-L-alanine amidase [Selenomonadaceae bacterium]|nr:N-acetylmuramoyl-L-alanine amidase [Selenomonadaceae bacterium]
MKTFHLDGGPKGHRFVIDVGNADFKVNPELNKPDDNSDAELKAKQEAELKAKQEAELKAKQDAELKAKQDAELKAKQDAELKAKQDAELREQQERERELERRERELAQRERELKEQEERELREKQERELKEKQERELKAQQERERELERRERELEQREREFKEKQERELKKRQERELKEQQELKEKQEKELKKQQERELKEKREKEIKAQREREKELKEKEKQERREKKDKEKKDKDKTDDEKETDEPIKELDSDLDEIMALSGKKIVIDPGHGGNDAGAIGPTGVMEKSVTLKVGLELKRLLEAEGATVIMTRETDTTVSSKGAKASDIEELGARCDVANRNGADIFISIHADSFTRPEARGTTGYYYSKSTSGRGQKLADCIRRNLVEQLGTPSRGTQPCNFYVVKNTDMPATLIELGFISNKDEEKLLDSKEGVQKAAQGILDGIEDYFG